MKKLFGFFQLRQADKVAPSGPSNEASRGFEKLVNDDTHSWRKMCFLLSYFSGFLMFVVIGLIVFMVNLSTSREVVPFLVQLDHRENAMTTISPIMRDRQSMDIIVETLICQYVIARNEVRPDEPHMINLWGRDGIVAILSTDPVYDRFSETFSILDYYAENNFHRYVELLSLPVFQEEINGNLYYRLDFRIINYDANLKQKIEPTQQFTAQIGVVTGAQKVMNSEQKYANPIGMRVFSYTEGRLLTEGINNAAGDINKPIRCGRGLITNTKSPVQEAPNEEG